MSEVVVRRLAPESAGDRALMDSLSALVNEVYAEAERGLWRDGADRTSAAELAEMTAAGRIVVATVDGEVVGCVRVDRLAEDLGEFGMLAADRRCRGAGVGRELIRFAEQASLAEGCARMQLELLVPREWKHPSKEFVAAWYERLGYRLTHVGEPAEYLPELAPLLATTCDFRLYHKDLGQRAG
ncbi:GNAT family N-acetyltransferase [Labedaea rhizosphaerae]|uniref:Acetyltransferase (GNAT) family protein n=1 Tax=Labedaea rhizosphaerae TaxID=598644 RepID=A0A4R6RW05_LABRH|nr:GNAT family N-acetyltransferase [Labedaea rhizosphaerae]TDP91192.1 acetyltransferase (GNAT) family protein [Labedaea rhizosphaerae]